jgi:GR25 family glycosyltransferase involved in LPS biosynthesis
MILVLLFILLILYNIFISYKNKKIEIFFSQSNFLNSIVNQIYIINMDKDHERLKIIDKKMMKLGLKYKRIKGIDGKKIYSKYKNKTKLKPGQLGCLLSHINVLEDAIKNKYKNILVLEDDVLFHKNFHEEFKKKYEFLKNNENEIDLVYLGSSQKHKWKNININKHYYKSYKNDGTFAMLINNNIFIKLLNLYKKLNLPSDRVLYHNIQGKMNCFTFHKTIITVNIELISNTEEKYLSLKLNNYLKSNKLLLQDFDL